MSLRGIGLYCLRAAAFAGCVCAVYALLLRIRGRRIDLRRLGCIAYLAALIQITVLRGGAAWGEIFHALRPLPQLVPLKTTLEALNDGLWPLVYHAAGNMLWFMPLGWMLRKGRLRRAVCIGMAVSILVETGQFALMTGAADIDDLIFNTLGAWLGFILARAICKKEQCK